MTDSDLHAEAADIHDQLPDSVDVTTDDIEERLTTLVADYKVPLDEARRSVVSKYLDESDADREPGARENQEVDLADIDEPEQWLDLTAKVVVLGQTQPHHHHRGGRPRNRGRRQRFHLRRRPRRHPEWQRPHQALSQR